LIFGELPIVGDWSFALGHSTPDRFHQGQSSQHASLGHSRRTSMNKHVFSMSSVEYVGCFDAG